MNVYRNLKHTGGSLLLIALVCLASPTLTNAAEQENKAKQQQKSASEQQAHEFQLPDALAGLDLSDDQEETLKKKLKQHDQQMQATWNNFHRKHMRAVELEAAWAAAVRDTLSDDDQMKFDQKRKEHHMQKMKKKMKESKSEPTTAQSGDQKDQTEQAESDEAQEKPNRRERRRDRQIQQASAEEPADKTADKSEADDTERQQLFVITITSPVRYLAGMRQNEKQHMQCTKACRQYAKEIHAVWQEVDQLHDELVQIEASRMTAIEEVLTEEQLQQLQQDRSEPSRETAAN